MEKQNLGLNIISHIKRAVIYKEEMEQILKNFVEYFGIKKPVLVDVTIIGPKLMKRLNAEYRKKDYVTDILSFDFRDDELYDALPFLHLGELIICWEKVERQAKQFNHSVRREFCYLFTHGLVHLKGYDHEVEEERIEMNNIVDAIFKPLNITRED
ncbi:rRNA maturation RNase YbeY [Mycoplasma sp. NEAQ87857]|uniref:rRNA maturation RNase YbeY n=1 Tax=Mycoplasma sp. NEAQ87857 TaxID=2683967 RepID=UPI001317214E|nr:rRNA maturation RNase YbeY [Mycoplasma sp. NEAQ87857]QGZ97745.1 rRNA maturation RNase YbeY [Mycoplasma sp. NEAQ87857]